MKTLSSVATDHLIAQLATHCFTVFSLSQDTGDFLPRKPYGTSFSIFVLCYAHCLASKKNISEPLLDIKYLKIYILLISSAHSIKHLHFILNDWTVCINFLLADPQNHLFLTLHLLLSFLDPSLTITQLLPMKAWTRSTSCLIKPDIVLSKSFQLICRSEHLSTSFVLLCHFRSGYFYCTTLIPQLLCYRSKPTLLFHHIS